MDRSQARAMLSLIGCAHRPDFHTLPAATVEAVIEQADLVKYRKPKNANGSRARYFYAFLTRVALRDE